MIIFSIALNILVLSALFLIVFSCFIFFRINKSFKAYEKKIGFLILTSASIILCAGLLLWFIKEKENKDKDTRIENLISQNSRLMERNKELNSDKQNLIDEQRKLNNEKGREFEQNKLLSNAVSELTKVIKQKEKRIVELRNNVFLHSDFISQVQPFGNDKFLSHRVHLSSDTVSLLFM